MDLIQKIKECKSQADFFAMKSEILEALEGKKSKKKRGE